MEETDQGVDYCSDEDCSNFVPCPLHCLLTSIIRSVALVPSVSSCQRLLSDSEQGVIISALASSSLQPYFMCSYFPHNILFISSATNLSSACQSLHMSLPKDLLKVIIHYGSVFYAEELLGLDFSGAAALLENIDDSKASALAGRGFRSFPKLGVTIYSNEWNQVRRVSHTDYSPKECLLKGFGSKRWSPHLKLHNDGVYRDSQGILPFGVVFDDDASTVLSKALSHSDSAVPLNVNDKSLTIILRSWKCVFKFASDRKITSCITTCYRRS